MLRKHFLILLCLNNNENYSLFGKTNLPDTAKYVGQGESENFPEHQQHLEETEIQINKSMKITRTPNSEPRG